MMPLGNNLRDLRQERGLSQKQLARRVGLDCSTIALYETGDRNPSLPALIKLAGALGVTTDRLLGVSKAPACAVDVSGLTQRQIDSILLIIENYRER